MTSHPKITRIILTDKENEEYFIFGLVSSEADYKLSQLLNKKLSISLRHNKTIEIEGNKVEKMSYSRYSFSSGSPGVVYNLISNRSEKDYLLKKLKRIDYFFLIQDNENSSDINHIMDTLRDIEKITAVFRLDPMKIRDKNLNYLTL